MIHKFPYVLEPLTIVSATTKSTFRRTEAELAELLVDIEMCSKPLPAHRCRASRLMLFSVHHMPPNTRASVKRMTAFIAIT